MMNVCETSPFETILTNALLEGKLRICGGEGEDDPKPVDDAKPEGDPKPVDGPKPEDGDDIEAKYLAEKQQRIQLQKDLEKRDEDLAKVNATVESERDDYKAKYEKMLAYVEKDGLENAINKMSAKKTKDGNPTYQWEDVEAVRVFIDPNKIRLDLDSGNVEGLDAELKRIAKEKPYLLSKPADNTPPAPPLPAGTPNSGSHPSGNTHQRETDREKLKQKYRIGPQFANVRPV
jgi:hypothetical protein